MKPIYFSVANKKLIGDKTNGVKDMPVFTDGRECISCWKLSWKERFRILCCGIVWLRVASGYTSPPVSMTTEYPFNEPSKKGKLK